MIYLKDFFNFRRYLEIGNDYLPRRIVTLGMPEGEKLSKGFFVDSPQTVALAESAEGPRLIVQASQYPIGENDRFELRGAGTARTLALVSNGVEVVRIAAPVSDFVDPNMPDEPDMSDFFIWLERRAQLPHVRKSMTTPT